MRWHILTKEAFNSIFVQNITFMAKNLVASNLSRPAKTLQQSVEIVKKLKETAIQPLNLTNLKVIGKKNISTQNQAIKLKATTQDMMKKTLGNQNN